MSNSESAWWRHVLKLATCGIKASDLLQSQIEGKDKPVPPTVQSSELVEMITYIKDGKFAQVLHQTIAGRSFLTHFKSEFIRLSTDQGASRSFIKSASMLGESVASKLRSEILESSEPEVKLMETLLCGIASLLCYLQVNYAGLVLAAPSEDEANLATSMFEELMMGSSEWIEVKPQGEVITAEAKRKHADIRAKARAALAANGEDCYPCIHFPTLLVFARTTLTLLCNQLESANASEGIISILSSEIALLWRLRAVNAHHRALIGNTETVRLEFLSLLPRLTEAWNSPKVNVTSHPQKTNSVELTGLSELHTEDKDSDTCDSLKSLAETHASFTLTALSNEERWVQRYLTGCTALELNELAGEFWYYGISEQLFDIASVVGGYVAKITGVMGRRTRYQNTSYSQLVLAGATEENMLNCPFSQPNSSRFSTVMSGSYPYDIPLEDSDDILYHHIKLDNKEDLVNAAKTAVSDYCQAIGIKSAFDTDPPVESQSFSGFALTLFSDLAQAAIVSAAEHDRKSKPNFATATEQILAQATSVISQYREFSEDVETQEVKLDESKVESSAGKGNIIDKDDDLLNTSLPELPTPETQTERDSCGDEVTNTLTNNEDTVEPKQTKTLINARFEKLPGARPFWGSYFSALTMRSLLESEESRRHLRALIQLETLIAMYPASTLERLGTRLSHAKALDELRKVRTAGADETNMSFIICKASQVPSCDEILLRMDGIFTSSMTSWWLLKRTYAELAQLKNMKQAALETYVEIGLWGRVIEAYIELGRGAQAEKMVRNRLPNQGYLPEARTNTFIPGQGLAQETLLQSMVGPSWPENMPVPLGASEEHIVTSLGSEVMENTVFDRYSAETNLAADGSDSQKKAGTATSYFDVPEHRLWAFLGDLMDDPAYYLKSWEVSNSTFGYAQRQLGKFLLKHKKYQGAVRAFRLALEINSAQPKLWYACGVCYFELFELSQAIDSFTRCVALQPDNGEAWNNIAAAHLFLRNRRSALGALEHATRLMFSNWKVWENYMYCALDLNEPTKALKALERLTNLRGSTDKNTLITVQFSARQAKLQMLALSHITNSAVEDAEKHFDKFTKDGDRSQFVTLSGPNIKGVKIESPSIISQKLLSVITMLEDTVAAMKASESSMGGRTRGGGVEAGEANSLTAQVAVEENQKRDIRRLKALSGIDEEDDNDDEDDDEEEGKGNDGSEEEEEKVEDESKSPKGGNKLAKKGPILDKSYGSIATQYHAFLHDCAARLFAANWAFQLAAERRERQANLILSLRGWATHQRLVDTIVNIVYETVRLYSLAQKEAKGDENTELASKMASSAKFFVQRVLSSLQLSERNGEVTQGEELIVLKKAEEEVSQVLSSLTKKIAESQLEQEQQPDQSPASSKATDSYDAYFGSGGYDDWRD